jgi:hypothetical protein
MKKLNLLIGLVAVALLLNSCFVGYVASEPSYVEYSRPAPPGNQYVWVDGDWGWNNQRHSYVQKSGYWVKPRQGQSYVSGNWQTTPRGKSWSKGHWQKKGKR